MKLLIVHLLRPPVASAFLGPNIFLITQFSSILSLNNRNLRFP